MTSSMGRGDASAIDEAGFAEGDVDTMSSTLEPDLSTPDTEEPEILEEIEVEDLAVDG